MYFKKNHLCENCNFPFKTVWNCKKTIDEKNWILLCYNCIRIFKHQYRWRFKPQLQNVKGFRWCGLSPSKMKLSLYEINI
jgi:hypothetical protein